MLLNKCSPPYCSAAEWLTKTLDDIDTKKILYHIPLSMGTNGYVIEVNEFVNKTITGLDGIILDCVGEAPEVARFRELINILLNAGYTRNQTSIVRDRLFADSLIIFKNWIKGL